MYNLQSIRYDEESETFEYNGRVYDVNMDSDDMRHGGPFDRGSADSYYGRPFEPHYYVGDTYSSERVTTLNAAERDAYFAGHAFNDEITQDFKDWG